MEEEEYLDDSKKIEVKGVETAPIAEEVIQPVEDIVVDIEEPKKTKPKTTSTKDVTKPIIDTTSAVEEEVQTKDIFDDLRKKPFPAAMEFSTPKTSQEAFSRQLGSRAAAPTTSTIKGFTGIIDYDALQEIYAPVDLASGIPDPQERESFIASNGSKMVKLFNENDFGVKFESDLADLAKYKEKQYPLAVKKFIDDLDANQGWMAETALTFAKFIGKIAVGVPATMLASVYGAGSALVNWDSRKFYDNAVMDAAEYLDQSVDKYTAIYGGSNIFDFEVNPDTGIYEFKQKDFLARMASDPLKSINADVVPAAAFIADMVISESVYGALTTATGGLATGGLAVNTARLANKAKQLGGWATRTGQYSKANRILRGIDKVDDVKAAADIAEKTQRYRSAFGTIGSMYRSSAYESALIARDTDKHTLELLISQHKEREGTEPTKLDLARYKDLAKSAGEQAYGLNAILVGGSNLIQFPRLLTKNYRVASSRKGVFDSLKLGGTQFKNGKHIANVDAKKYLKTLGYAKSAIKGGVTEGFEELSQGALEEGLVDYFASKYSEDSNRSGLELINAITNKASTYLNTVEGRDSVTIGAMMGMLGIRVPFAKKSDSKLGFSLTTKGFGGARQEIQETRKKIDRARSTAESLNSDLNFNPVLSATFENSTRHTQSQKNMDAAANNGDTYRYKNSEFDSLFSLVHTRTKLGLEDTIAQELDGALEMPIEKFNETYATKGVENYTEETRAQAVESAKNTAAKMVESIKSVEALLADKKPDLLTRAAEEAWLAVTGKEAKTTLDLSQVEQSIKDQMVYLHAAVENTSKREAELLEQIREKTGHSFPLSTLDRLLTQVSGVRIEDGKLTFSNRAQQVKDEVLKEYENLLDSYKKEDPVNYNMNVAEVSDLLDDVLKLKIRRGEASRMYRELFTEKGSKAFADFAVSLSIAADKKRNKVLKDIIKKETEETRNATLARQQKNELSVSGNTEIVDAKINSDTVNGIKEIQAREEDPTNSDEDLVDGMLKTLDTYPGLLTLVKERLEDRGIPTEGITVAQEIQLRDSDGTMLSNFFKEIAILKKEVKAMEEAMGDTFKADSADQLGQVQSKEGVPVLDKDVIEDDVSEALSKGKQVTDKITIINTFDKKIEAGKTVKGEDGKAVKHSVNKQYYPLDANKVNDPDFLNNLELTSEKRNFTFRVQKDNPYNDTASVENMAIEVVYIDPVTQEETFISRLPAYKKGMPKQLLEFRKEVVKRSEVTEDISEDNVKRIQEIKKEKEVIKKKLQENLDAKKEALVKEKPRYEDKIVPVGKKTFTVTNSMEGTTKTYQVREYLDGSEKFTEILEDGSSIPAKNFRALKSLNDIKAVYEQNENLSVEITKEEDYKSVMNPKMFDKLTADQQQRVDSERAKASVADTQTSEVEAKEAEIEKRRQEELDQYSFDIVEKVEDFEATNEEGETTYIQVRYYKDGSRKIYFSIKKNNYGNPTSSSPEKLAKEFNINNLQLYFDEVAFGKLEKVGERTSEEANLSRRKNKINAKYDAELTALETTQPTSEITEKDFSFKKGRLDTFTLVTGQEVKGSSIIIEGQPNVDLFTYNRKNYGWSVIDNKSKKEYPLSEFNEGTSTKREILELLPNEIIEHSKQEKSKKILESLGFNFPQQTQPTAEVTEEEFKEFIDNATVSDARINAIVNKIKTGTELTTQEQAMREEKAAQVEEALQEDTTTEVDAGQAELKAELSALNEELRELMGDISPKINLKEESIFEYISDLTLIEDTKLKNSKETELKKNFGEDNVERANAINANFNTIIEEINKSGINIFFDPKTNKHQNGCD